MTILFKGLIRGVELGSKSNSRRLVRYGGVSRLIKSQKALDWSEAAQWQIKAPVEPLRMNLTIVATVWYASRRPDLDIALLCDFLQNQGIIENDRQIFRIEAEKRLDPKDPRVEFYLTEFKALD